MFRIALACIYEIQYSSVWIRRRHPFRTIVFASRISALSSLELDRGYDERLRFGSEESDDFRLTLYSSPGVHS